VNRRTFVLLLVGAGAAGGSAWRLLVAEESTHPAVEGLFRDVGAAKRVGEAYLAEHAGEADERKLLSLLELPSGLAPEALRERLGAAVRLDYERSQLVAVEGWYLSRTEARLCALSTYG
jgi:hypothetical protein